MPLTPPSVSCAATPNTLWPPNGQPVVVTVSGTVTAGTQAIPVGGTTYAVKDEYGQFQPSGAFALGAGGSYSFDLSLIAARNGYDKDGRQYNILVSAMDSIGNVGSCSTVVISSASAIPAPTAAALLPEGIPSSRAAARLVPWRTLLQSQPLVHTPPADPDRAPLSINLSGKRR